MSQGSPEALINIDRRKGKLYAINIYWPEPGLCYSYYPVRLGRWYYKGLSEKDYVEAPPGSEHAKACFDLVKGRLATNELRNMKRRK